MSTHYVQNLASWICHRSFGMTYCSGQVQSLNPAGLTLDPTHSHYATMICNITCIYLFCPHCPSSGCPYLFLNYFQGILFKLFL